MGSSTASGVTCAGIRWEREIHYAFRKRYARMPLTKHERLASGAHHRKRGSRPALAQRVRKMPGVILVLDRPAQGDASACEPGERTRDVPVDLFACDLELGLR